MIRKDELKFQFSYSVVTETDTVSVIHPKNGNDKVVFEISKPENKSGFSFLIGYESSVFGLDADEIVEISKREILHRND